MGMMQDRRAGFRPGGFSITDDAVRAAGKGPGSKILDVGCGEGATVRYLSDRYRYDAYGVDIDGAAVESAKQGRGEACADRFFCADATTLPFEGDFFDMVLFECSFSLIVNPADTLKEVNRVLKSGGMLAISDLYARKKARTIEGNRQLLHFYGETEIEKMVAVSGFEILSFADYSGALAQMVGQMLFDGEKGAFEDCFQLSLSELRDIGGGYFLLMARK